jgi:hypothetical protein
MNNLKHNTYICMCWVGVGVERRSGWGGGGGGGGGLMWEPLALGLPLLLRLTNIK